MGKGPQGINKRLSQVTALVLLPLSVFAEPERPASFERDNLPAARQWLSTFVEESMEKESIPGVSVALIEGDSTLWSQNFGYANKEQESPVTPDTVFRVGGVTTLFTAVAIMQLHEQGKIKLDEPVVTYLPEFRVRSHRDINQAITIRHLLSHHSGLPITIYKGMWASEPQPKQSVLDYIANNYMPHSPGELYAFSNLGYVILGLVIEKLSGLSYEQYVRQKIIEPLGLKNTGFHSDKKLEARLAQGYKKDEPRPLLYARDVPALGLYSTAEDLARFLQSFNGVNAVLSSHSRAAMMHLQNADNPWDMERGVGLGWHLDEKRLPKAGPVAARWGSTLLYRSRVLYAPHFGMGVVVNANSSKGFRVIDDIAIETLRTALEVRHGIVHEPLEKNTLKLEALPNAGGFVGEYVTMAGYANIVKKGDDFSTRLLGWNIHLVPQANGWFSAQYDFLGFLPIKLDWFAETRFAPAVINNEQVLITYFNGRKSVFGVELGKGIEGTKWASRAGEYAIANRDELMDFYDVKSGKLWSENGRLFFSYDIPVFLSTSVTLPIIPVSDELAIIPGKGSAMNETLRIVQRNGKERIVFSGYELEKPEPSSFWGF